MFFAKADVLLFPSEKAHIIFKDIVVLFRRADSYEHYFILEAMAGSPNEIVTCKVSSLFKLS